MEPSSLRLKKFLYFLKNSPCTFHPKLKKIKKSTPQKNSLYFRKWNFFALILKKSQETVTPKKKPYLLGNGNSKRAS